MKALGLAAVLMLALPAVALAGGHKPPVKPLPPVTTLNACDLQGLTGHGMTIANGNVCLQVTGEVDYTTVWGNARGGYGEPGGRLIVRTPAGDSTIPAPRN